MFGCWIRGTLPASDSTPKEVRQMQARLEIQRFPVAHILIAFGVLAALLIGLQLGYALKAATVITTPGKVLRSEEHTSELQSLRHLVCRLLLEKKKKKIHSIQTNQNAQQPQ